VAELVAIGLTNLEIAVRLFTSERKQLRHVDDCAQDALQERRLY
jgi:hypothetical protein